MNVTTNKDMRTGDTLVICSVSAAEKALLGQAIYAAIVNETGKAVAEKFVAENYQAIAAKIDTQAVANLAVAYAGNKIKDMLDKKLPDRVEHHYHERVVTDHSGFGAGVFTGAVGAAVVAALI